MNYDILLRKASINPVSFYSEHDFKDLQKQLHPDRWIGSDFPAKDYFIKFAQLYETVKTPADKYLIANGDLCKVYLSKCGEKIIKEPIVKANKLLRREASNIALLNFAGKHRTLFPILESSKDNLVFAKQNAESLLGLLNRKPDLNPRHLAWICRRTLLALMLIHSKGICHGAVTPEHLLIDGEQHGIVLIDWKHAGKIDDNIVAVPKKYSDMYFLEKTRKKLSTALDISMLGSTMRRVAKNCPKKLLAFFKYMEIGRQTDAYKVDVDLKEVLVQVFGPPKWVDLD